VCIKHNKKKNLKKKKKKRKKKEKEKEKLTHIARQSWLPLGDDLIFSLLLTMHS
jgi:hypothetical protein